MHMTEESKPARRTLIAPSNAGAMSGGELLSVDVGSDEDVEWVWTHDRVRGSAVTGYRVVPRVTERGCVA